MLPWFALVSVQGPDSEAFLQAQLACDLRQLLPQRWRYAAWCEARGKVDHTMALGRASADAWHALVPAERAADFERRVSLYRLRQRVTVQRQAVLVESLAAGALVFEGDFSASGPIEFAGLARVLSSAAGTHDASSEVLRASGEAGWVWLATACAGQHLPQSLDLLRHGAVSLRKGCYPGQEIVARVHYLAKGHDQLVELSALDDAPTGVDLASTLRCDAGDGSGQILYPFGMPRRALACVKSGSETLLQSQWQSEDGQQRWRLTRLYAADTSAPAG